VSFESSWFLWLAPMKCDRCGCQFPAHEASTATYNEAVKQPGRWPYTEIRRITLCPSCTASRSSLLRFYVLLAAIVILALAIYSALR
jgi:hypothetical protein